MNNSDIRPFKLHIEDDILVDLKERLKKTRWPDQLNSPSNDEWLYGAELLYIKKLAKYWEQDFDWRANEARFNAMGPQFITKTKDGRRLHFLHKKSSNPNATPLLISHGWPGSIFEFVKIIPKLTNDFHIITPSIPGYFYSEPYHERGGNFEATADDFHHLMIKLGYNKYFVQGGDWGALIVKSMALKYPKNVLALHTNMPIASPPKGFRPESMTRVEMDGMAKTQYFSQYGLAYQKIQGQKPQTLSYGLNDSPVGLLSWIMEKFHSWTFNHMELLTKDDMLTTIMLYWSTNSIGSSIRFYFENGSGSPPMPGVERSRGGKVIVPSACVHFPNEIYQFPKSWCYEGYNMIRYNRYDIGGHFAAFETPEIMAKDMKEFFLVDYPNYLNNNNSSKL
jgi:epoxide hydrolase